PRAASLQRWLLAGGAAALAAGRELGAPTFVLALAGSAVTLALLLLVRILLGVRRSATQRRFDAAVDHDLAALAFGLAGAAAGILLATGAAGLPSERLRPAHLTANLLGL